MDFCTNKNKKTLEIFHKSRLIFKHQNSPLDLSALIEGAQGTSAKPEQSTGPQAPTQEAKPPQEAWDKMVDQETATREKLDAMQGGTVDKVRSLTRRAVNRAKGIPGAVKSIPLLGPAISLPGKLAGKVGRGVKRLLRRRKF